MAETDESGVDTEAEGFDTGASSITGLMDQALNGDFESIVSQIGGPVMGISSEETPLETDAETVEQANRDIARQLLRIRREEGAVSPSTGVSKPTGLSSVKTFEDVLEVMRGWDEDMRRSKKEKAYEMNEFGEGDSPAERKFEFLSQLEGVRKRAYDDETGLPVSDENPATPGSRVTVGVGFNMDRPDAREVFKVATGLGDEEFDAVKAGKRKLDMQEVRALFDETVREAEQIVSNRLLDDLVLDEHEYLSLVSMAFNHPDLIGPNLVSHLKSGRKDKALEEILFNSNRSKHKGLANRRYKEAAMFAGDQEIKTALPEYSEYIKNFT